MSKYLFNNYGGSYQLNIEKPKDLRKIVDLDEALWAATSLPIEILNIDKKFLEYLDTDENGRIRTDEIKYAVQWVFNILKDCSHLSEGTDVLLLDNINIDIPEGKTLQDTSKIILSNLNVPNSPNRINLSQVRNLQGIMASSTTNGDGVIAPDATTDKELSDLIVLIMETIGSSNAASGKLGINSTQTSEFFTQASLYLEWLEKGQIPDNQENTDIMVWGRNTIEAYSSLKKVARKVDEFFAQCAISQFDSRVKESLQLKEKELEEIDFTDKSLILDRLKTAPLAKINNENTLYLDGYINSLYSKDISDFKEKVLVKIYDENISRLDLEKWENVKNIFAPYKDYTDNKKGEKVEKIDVALLRKYIEEGFQERIYTLIKQDLAVAEEIKHIKDVEKLLLYQKFLFEFANNSASFSNVYNPEIRSIFEVGTLIIDGRKMPFTILVNNMPAHKKIAQESNVYLIYLTVTSKDNGETQFNVATSVTSGDSGNLRIGKRGVFFTRDGKEWDAEVIDIIVNPIGLLESIKAPFIKLADSIKNQVEKFAKTKEAKLEGTLVAPTGASVTRDLMVGGGVAIAAIGSSFAYIARAVSQVKLGHFLTTIIIILATILVPSLLMGIVKLRRRNLSILFEASGCAINVRMKLTLGLGKLFTYIPAYPPNSQRKKLDIIEELTKKIKMAKEVSWEQLFKTIFITLLVSFLVFILVILMLKFRILPI
ncbi:hypothetical protein M0P98_07885 [bacterium]|nr:hypothetical protein [bacterium]